MIAVICTKCRATLEVDEAFAGSACRCHHCGTIQTVPGRSSGKKRTAAPAGGSSRTLYSNESRVSNVGTGLNELADIVASSGLHQQVGAPKKPEPKSSGVPMVWVVGIGAAAGVIILGLMMLLLNRGPQYTATSSVKQPDSRATPAAADAQAPAVAASSPQFLGIDLAEPTVIYLIDRGSSARESLGYAHAATIRSVQTLGADRKFQIMFWDNAQPDIAYPPTAPNFATAHDINAARRATEGVVAFGRSDVIPPLSRALAARPGAIVLITAKGWELDDSFFASVQATRGGSKTKIHAVSIGGASDALERVAKASGGQFKSVTPGELREFAEN